MDSHAPSASESEAQAGRTVSHSFKLLDKDGLIAKTRRNLPHWRQDGCMYYATFRMADSVPQSLLKKWQEERRLWLQLNPRPWIEATLREYTRRFQGPIEKWLDAGHGACALRDSAKREVVASALRFFDGERYTMDAFVVMPNHVHALVVPRDGARAGVGDLPSTSDGSGRNGAAAQAGRTVSHSLSGILHSWKSFTAHELVKRHGLPKPVWMDENFNHAVRSERQWLHFRNYIRENPAKAKLRAGEWTHWECDEARQRM